MSTAIRSQLLILLTATLPMGCAHINVETKDIETYLRTERESLPATSAVAAVGSVNSTPGFTSVDLTIKAERVDTCHVRRANVFSRKQVFTRTIDGDNIRSGSGDDRKRARTTVGLELALGGVTVAAGGGLLTAAPGMSDQRPIDPVTGRVKLDSNGNPEVSPRAEANFYGVGMLLIGAPFALVGTIEALRAKDSVVPRGEFVKDESVFDSECGRSPLAECALEIDAGGARIPVGKTNEVGAVVVPLTTILATPGIGSLTESAWNIVGPDGPAGIVELSPEAASYIAAVQAASWNPDRSRLTDLLNRFPDSASSSWARSTLNALAETERQDFQAAARSDAIPAYTQVLQQHPDADPGLLARARERLAVLLVANARVDEKKKAFPEALESLHAARAYASSPAEIDTEIARVEAKLNAAHDEAVKRAVALAVERSRKAEARKDYAGAIDILETAATDADTKKLLDAEASRLRARIPLAGITSKKLACEVFPPSVSIQTVLQDFAIAPQALDGRVIDIGGFNVIQVVGDGFLGSMMAGGSRNIYFHFANPNTNGSTLVDGQNLIGVLGLVNGTYRYENVIGSTSTVQRIDVIWLNQGQWFSQSMCGESAAADGGE